MLRLSTCMKLISNFVTHRPEAIKSIFEDGYSWVEIDDSLWATREYFTYVRGMDIT